MSSVANGLLWLNAKALLWGLSVDLPFKTLQEDTIKAAGESIIVHHQTMTNKPHRPFQLGLVGRKTHQTEFFTTFVSYWVASREGSASISPHPHPPAKYYGTLKNHGEENMLTDTHRLPQNWKDRAACGLRRRFLRLILGANHPEGLVQGLRMRLRDECCHSELP